MDAKKRQCLECGFQVIGRPEKIFCSDTCRTRYNNTKYKENDHAVIRINRILKKNRKIILALLNEGKSINEKDRLSELGFDFNYYTSLIKTPRKPLVYCCYEVGYMVEKKNKIKMIALDNSSFGNT